MAKAEVVILGTASMIPTKERNLTSIFLKYKDKGILFDCGEGTQRQMKHAGVKPGSINKILISHWHGDHVLGLPGLLQTMGNSDYTGTLEIIGPKGTKTYLSHMLQGFVYDTKIELKVTEADTGVFYEDDDFYLEAQPLSHGTLTLGYGFVEKDQRRMDKDLIKDIPGVLVGELQQGKEIAVKGKKISPNMVSTIQPGIKIGFVFDTEPCNGAALISEDADLLLCEATFLSTLEEKGFKYKHMTAAQAATLASNNNVKRLVLCHFSGRYKSTKELEDEAKDIFPNSKCAYDLMKIKV